MVKMKLSDMDMSLTEEEMRELDAAAEMVPVSDEDCPVMTAEKLRQFRRAGGVRRTKPTVSLRISPETLRLAKAYGKGYTTFLSRLLDEAINDEDLVRRCI